MIYLVCYQECDINNNDYIPKHYRCKRINRLITWVQNKLNQLMTKLYDHAESIDPQRHKIQYAMRINTRSSIRSKMKIFTIAILAIQTQASH